MRYALCAILLLTAVMGFAQVPVNTVIATVSHSGGGYGSTQVYLCPGLYYIIVTGNVATTAPFSEYNLYYVGGALGSHQGTSYNTVPWASSNYPVAGRIPEDGGSFLITSSGNYTFSAGIAGCSGVTVLNSTGKLYASQYIQQQ
jgi:hypothetical protein